MMSARVRFESGRSRSLRCGRSRRDDFECARDRSFFAVIDHFRVCYAETVAVDFDEFEQLVLKVLFETDVAVTAAHVAYLGRISVRTAERHLARMVEQGALSVRTSSGGASVGPPPVSAGDTFFLTLRPKPSPITAVMLSMLIPGAGHIYAGRAGAGVAWMATTLMGYACCFLPGLFLHGLCLVSAAQTRQT